MSRAPGAASRSPSSDSDQPAHPTQQTPTPQTAPQSLPQESQQSTTAGAPPAERDEIAPGMVVESTGGDLGERLPTAEGHRHLEGSRLRRPRDAQQQQGDRRRARLSLRDLGPGFLSGMSGNDATAVTFYAVVGASVGYGLL